MKYTHTHTHMPCCSTTDATDHYTTPLSESGGTDSHGSAAPPPPPTHAHTIPSGLLIILNNGEIMRRAGSDIRSWLMNASTLSHFLTSSSVTENIRWHLKEKTRIKRMKQGEGKFIHFINDDIWLGQALHKYFSLTAGLLVLYCTLQPDFSLQIRYKKTAPVSCINRFSYFAF